jgi:hypothetical protein
MPPGEHGAVQPMKPTAVPSPRPRLTPELPLPPYAYAPGHFPHPISDPAGHSFGIKLQRPEPPDPQSWQSCRLFLYGVDLFNHGYYWEAHEVWEALWHGCGRTGTTAGFLKGLIKLAAAGVKARQGVTEGVRGHARRAAELFRQTASASKAGAPRYMGLALAELIGFAETLAARPVVRKADGVKPVEIVFDYVLVPE